jgi:monoamine oxidase
MVCFMQVSLSEWNQDERFGAFGGPHAMVMGGYGQLADAMAAGLSDIRYNEPVTEIVYSDEGVSVTTQSGMKLSADAVVVSVPIGVLQKGSISFSPPLPEWKTEAFTRIGMGKLNKVRFSRPQSMKIPNHVDLLHVLALLWTGPRGRCLVLK